MPPTNAANSTLMPASQMQPGAMSQEQVGRQHMNHDTCAQSDLPMPCLLTLNVREQMMAMQQMMMLQMQQQNALQMNENVV